MRDNRSFNRKQPLVILITLLATTSSVQASTLPPSRTSIESATQLLGQQKRQWGAEQATGAPDTQPPDVDSPTAWASLYPENGEEWLKLEYDNSVRPKEIHIYEVLARGAIVRVTAFDTNGSERTLWQGQDPLRNSTEWVWKLPVTTPIETKTIKLYLDCKAVTGWNEIDAVGLLGDDGIQWSSRAQASSTYADATGDSLSTEMNYEPVSEQPQTGVNEDANIGPDAWNAKQATGKPDTKESGDYPTAWASMNEDDGEEWLELGYEKELKPIELQVHENFNPGALVRATAIDADGEEVEIWNGADPTPPGSNIGVSNIAVKVPFKTSKVRLYLDTKRVPGWNEIDAVAARDADGQLYWASTADASSNYGESMIDHLTRRIERLTNEVRQLRRNQERLLNRKHKY